jgi:hypothetical protein
MFSFICGIWGREGKDRGDIKVKRTHYWDVEGEKQQGRGG